MKILLVDDESEILIELAETIDDEGYECITASTVDNAIELLNQQDDINLVISDLKMPGKDGFYLLGEVLAKPKKIEFILMSGHYQKELDDSKNTEFTYIKKPIDIDTLITLIEGIAKNVQ